MQLNWQDFNEMSYTGICNLPGIGKKVAERIVSMRPFRTNNDLFKVKGLGSNTLKKLGIEKEKKARISWRLMPDGKEYPTSTLAKDILTGQTDFFWRIPKERREYL
jgi:Holliday junction resolvasome RuvABC DNA-binding subunit